MSTEDETSFHDNPPMYFYAEFVQRALYHCSAFASNVKNLNLYIHMMNAVSMK